MKTVILCGGLGTRLSEETQLRPKPMVSIGPKPILAHIMDLYARQGFNEFVLPAGYRAEDIKSYFLNFHTLSSDFEIDLSNGRVDAVSRPTCDWRVKILDTGLNTLTGGRLWRVRDHLRGKGTFMLTYGDGLSDVNLPALLDFHKSHGRLATVTAVRPAARFGTMNFAADGAVKDFREKHQTDEGWINGGFFVLEEGVFDYLTDGDATVLEGSPMESLARDGQLMAHRHNGFWQCMDTIRDKQYLESLWTKGDTPWLVKP